MRIGRRELLAGLAATGGATLLRSASGPSAAVAFGASSAQTGGSPTIDRGKGFKAVAYNHISYAVPDYVKVRDFFVNLYGMRVAYDDGKQCSVEFGDPPNAIYIRPLRPGEKEAALGAAGSWSQPSGQGYVNHIAFSIENFDLAAVEAELKRRGLNPRPDGPYAWTIKDPNDFTIQICATRGVFPGAAVAGVKETDGTRNLKSIPGPRADSKYGWTIQDPAGMRIEVAGWGLPEHIGADCNGGIGGCPGGPDK